MRKRQEIADPASCLNRAADDEPVFVLRANDPSAPDAIRRWAAYYLADKQRRGPGQWMGNRRAQRKYREALELADEMQRWRMDRDAALARVGQPQRAWPPGPAK